MTCAICEKDIEPGAERFPIPRLEIEFCQTCSTTPEATRILAGLPPTEQDPYDVRQCQW